MTPLSSHLSFFTALTTGLIVWAGITYRDLILSILVQIIKSVQEFAKFPTKEDVNLHIPSKDPSMSLCPAAKKEHKPFDVRLRLWNEPPGGPELKIDYSWHACKDTMQKEFKAIGGPDFAWKTNWLDIRTELDLLRNYREWTVDQKRLNHISSRDRAFYAELDKDVVVEYNELRMEFKENNRKWGKTGVDAGGLYALMLSLGDRQYRENRA